MSNMLVFAFVCFAAGVAVGVYIGYRLGRREREPYRLASEDAVRHGVGYVVITAGKRGHFEEVRLNPTQVIVSDKPLTTGRRFE